ncbi:MAG: biotin synthase BioB [Anaerohalosphaeraceae bacterium]|nr:biotin synthase BioB [Anaerohalosphaeraceae bacterium]
MNSEIKKLAEEVLSGSDLERDSIDNLASLSKDCHYDLLYWANRIREKYFGNKVRLCSIVPGRLGGCNQDCKFCSQSASYKTAIDKTIMLSDEEIMLAAEKAYRSGVPNFGIVYSGRTVTEKELCRLEKLIPEIKSKYSLGICASLGIINNSQAKRLAAAGAGRYNHNLETSRRHFADVVTTHDYQARVETIKVAMRAGMGVCAGGIFGIGETDDDRIDMALDLRELGVDVIPMNFLHPIEGTPLENTPKLPPKEILRIIAMYRFILPKAHLKIAGGRVLNLRDMQSWMFYAGATALLSGDYLTTAGRSVKEDTQMVEDLGLRVECE